MSPPIDISLNAAGTGFSFGFDDGNIMWQHHANSGSEKRRESSSIDHDKETTTTYAVRIVIVLRSFPPRGFFLPALSSIFLLSPLFFFLCLFPMTAHVMAPFRHRFALLLPPPPPTAAFFPPLANITAQVAPSSSSLLLPVFPSLALFPWVARAGHVGKNKQMTPPL